MTTRQSHPGAGLRSVRNHPQPRRSAHLQVVFPVHSTEPAAGLLRMDAAHKLRRFAFDQAAGAPERTPITRRELVALASMTARPFVSIYQPLHRSYPQTAEDTVRFRDLLDGAERELLEAGIHGAELHRLLEPGWRTTDAPDEWRAGDARGLAVFLSQGFFRVCRVPNRSPRRPRAGRPRPA